MANTKSAAKRARQSISRARRNRSVRMRLRTLQKRVRAATASDPKDVYGLISALDKAAKRGIIHRNVANRCKARLNRTLTGAAKA